MNSPITTIFKYLIISLYFYQYASLPINNNIQKTTIIVDQSGKGNFVKVQDAINSIPNNNSHWIRIHVRAGIYNEKVTIPREKPFIMLEGVGRKITVIQAADGGTIFSSATLSLLAGNFVARNITFKNIHDKYSTTRSYTWAPAAVLTGDKAAFFDCGFISIQDTLTDNQGRHYFESCYIQGGVDFIWGNGQSIYHGCTINVTREHHQTRNNGAGYITAQAREAANSSTGFVFIRCSIFGTTSTYLGRAYTQYSRVIYYESHFTDIVVPEGWSAWSHVGHEKDIMFAEVRCSGPGANTSKRVNWEKKLSPKAVKSLAAFINQDGWMNKLPQPLHI